MGQRSVEDRIQKLPEEKQDELAERIDTFEEALEAELHDQHGREIDNQIKDDESELSDFNVVVSGFLERDDTGYSFIRTEPLIHENDKNFDLLLANRSKGIAVLVEIERTLLDRLPGKISNFLAKKRVVESNGADFDIEDYFDEVLSQRPDEIDYVLASQHLIESELDSAAAEEGIDFIAWMLASQGNHCRIKDITVKSDKTAPFDGHSDEELKNYIGTQLVKGVEKVDYVNFIYSSSKYLKLKHMSIALVNRYQRQTENASFTFEDWKHLFEADVDLYNYLEPEKETLFARYIKYAKEVGVVTIEENNGDVFENEYRVVSRATRDQEKLIDELMRKMADARMSDDLEEAVSSEKEEILIELEKEHATGGTTLFDFEEGGTGA